MVVDVPELREILRIERRKRTSQQGEHLQRYLSSFKEPELTLDFRGERLWSAVSPCCCPARNASARRHRGGRWRNLDEVRIAVFPAEALPEGVRFALAAGDGNQTSDALSKLLKRRFPSVARPVDALVETIEHEEHFGLVLILAVGQPVPEIRAQLQDVPRRAQHVFAELLQERREDLVLGRKAGRSSCLRHSGAYAGPLARLGYEPGTQRRLARSRRAVQHARGNRSRAPSLDRFTGALFPLGQGDGRFRSFLFLPMHSHLGSETLALLS
ncbi:hypothetical protein WME74_22030 [Sorangium sp. So ce341]